jgi:hypothetical protein
MTLSVTLYGIKFTIRIVIAILLPISWKVFWSRKGRDVFIDRHAKWFAKHGKEDHPAVIRMSGNLWAKMIYACSWLIIWLCVLALIGVLKGFGDATSKSIWITSSAIGFIGIFGGSQIIKESLSGLRVAMNKYGGTGDQTMLHHHHDKGVHHRGWWNELDMYSSSLLTDRFTDLIIENDRLREYAVENVDRDEFYHTQIEFPVNSKNRLDAIGRPGKKADPKKGIAEIPAVMGIADQIIHDDDYSKIKVLLADADDDDRARIAAVWKTLSNDDWATISQPSVMLTGKRTAILRLPVRSWSDEIGIRHAVEASGLLDKFYET